VEWRRSSICAEPARHLQHCDQAGNITYVNDKFARSALCASNCWPENHRSIKSRCIRRFYQGLWRCIVGGNVGRRNLQPAQDAPCIGGSTITPFLDSAGKPYQYVSYPHDITRLKAAEMALREKEELITPILNSVPRRLPCWTAT